MTVEEEEEEEEDDGVDAAIASSSPPLTARGGRSSPTTYLISSTEIKSSAGAEAQVRAANIDSSHSTQHNNANRDGDRRPCLLHLHCIIVAVVGQSFILSHALSSAGDNHSFQR